MIHWLLFVAATAAAVGTAAVVTSLIGLLDPLDRLLAAAVLFAVEVSAVLLVAGALRALRPGPVAALVAGLLLVAVVAALRWSGSRSRPRFTRPQPRRLSLVARAHPFAVTLLVLAALAVLWRLFVGIVMPPYGTDALWYHLTTVAGWVRSGHLGHNPLVLESSSYPASGELAETWSVLFLHSDVLVNLTQLPSAVIGGIAVAGIARTLDLDRPAQAVAGSLFVLTPIVLAQSSTAYVDVMFVAAFLVGVHFVLRYLATVRGLPAASLTRPPPGTHSTRLVVLGGLASGLALGVKTTGLASTGVIGLLIAAGLVGAQGRRVPVAEMARAVFCFAMAAIVVGGYWYVRDWVQFGNPVYPFQVSGVFSGPFPPSSLAQSSPPAAIAHDPAWLQVLRSWGHDLLRVRTLEPYLYDQRLGGLGVQWPLMLVLLVGLVIRAVRDRSRLLLEFVAALSLIWLVDPYRWWSRFTIYLAALGAIGVAVWTSRAIGPLWRRLIAGVTLIAVLFSFYLTTAQLPLGYGRQLSFSQVIGLAGQTRSQVTIGRSVCGSFAWVDQVPRNASIGMDPRYTGFIFPLYGRDISHPVVPLWASNRQQFLAKARTLDYIVLPVADSDRTWADGDPRALHLIYANGAVRVYSRTVSHPILVRDRSLAGCPYPTLRPAATNAALRRIDL